MYLLLIFLVIIEQGTCLQCFNCQRASSSESCLGEQVANECNADLKQPSCMSLNYKTERNKKIAHVFGKTCTEYKVCKNFCQRGSMKRRKECEATCCTRDECNKNTFDKTVITDFEQKAKRSNAQLNKDSANKQDHLRTNELLLLASIVTTVMLRYAVLKP